MRTWIKMAVRQTIDGTGEVVRQLVAAHMSGARIEDCRWAGTSGLETAYLVQRRFMESVGDTHAGWKIGITSSEAQALRKLDGPAYGRLVANRTYHCPSAVRRDLFVDPFIEVEFAFRMSRDVNPADGRGAVLEAIGGVHMAIEIVDGRLVDWRTCDGFSSIADNIAHGAAVIGEEIGGVELDALGGVVTALWLDGDEVATGTGGAVLGNPVSALIWLADALGRHCQRIRAGDFILSGTTTGISRLGKARSVSARFAGLGALALKFT